MSSLFRLLEDLDEPPALGAGERPALHHADRVPLAGLVLLVVGVQRAGRADHAAVDPVPADPVDPDRDRLVALVRDDDPLSDLALARLAVRGSGLGGPAGFGGPGCLFLLAPVSTPTTALGRLPRAGLATFARTVLGASLGQRRASRQGAGLPAPLLRAEDLGLLRGRLRLLLGRGRLDRKSTRLNSSH